MTRRVELLPHDPTWEKLYQSEAEKLRGVFGVRLVAIHPMGSTAVPGLVAKPIIDILPEVNDILDVDALNPAMEALGYAARGEYGIPGRRYFVKSRGEIHLFHVHVFQTGNPEIARHLNFVAYLRAHPQAARDYGELKLQLAAQFSTDLESYSEGKSELIRAIDDQAKAWAKTQPPTAGL